MLSVQRVEKHYGSVRALAGIDLDLAAGETLCVLGPNGAGKSTLVSVIAGLLRPDKGRVHIAGIDVARDPSRVAPLIGLAPQSLGIYPTFTVRKNLEVFGRLTGLRGALLHQRVDEVVQAVHLSALVNRPARFLSGGEQRRLHTAVAFLHRPRLLLLDEPTVGADIQTRQALLELVRQSASEGAAVLYSTHYLGEVDHLDGEVAIIHGGRIVAAGTVDDLVARAGVNVVEARFEGPAPETMERYQEMFDGGRYRIPTADPTAVMADIVGRLTIAEARRLEGLFIIRPSLESVFAIFTGHRAPNAGNGAEHVVVT